MAIPMTAIEMTGTIDENSHLTLDGPLPFSGPTRVRVIILSSIHEEIDETSWMQAASQNPAFSFLADTDEAIYSITDGKSFHDAL